MTPRPIPFGDTEQIASTYIYYKRLAGGARSELASWMVDTIRLLGFDAISLLKPSIEQSAAKEIAASARNIVKNEMVCSCDEVWV